MLSVSLTDNQEPLVVIRKKDIPNGYLPSMSDMTIILQGRIFVRQGVYERLKQAQEILRRQNQDFSLYITYGYRGLEVQTRKFLEQLRETSSQTFFSNPVDLYEAVHLFIAVPTVAGPPTGGAI